MTKSISSAAVPVTTAASEDDLLLRKVAWRIIPFLFVCYVVSFLDRINIGFAQLQMKHDLGFSDAMYGLGAAVFYIGYVLCEVPSNLLLAKYGARRTFTRIMLLWGLASVGMMFVSSPAHFYLLRFLLGVFEAGFFPGIVLYLTFWFPANRRAAVLSVFFAGVAVAGVFGGLVSGWIMRDMSGVMGLFGWQWMFAIEGAPAVLLAVFALYYLVDSPRLVECLVWEEADLGRELEIDGVGNLAADVLAVALKGLEHWRQVFSSQRHNVDGGEPQVGRHAHLGDGHDMGGEHVVVHVAAREHLGEGVADELAHAQLALRGAGLAVALPVGHGSVGPCGEICGVRPCGSDPMALRLHYSGSRPT